MKKLMNLNFKIMNNSIAIVGMSFDLPNIKNWNELRDSLYKNTSHIGEIPEHRLKEIHEAFGEVKMARGGYLNEIDKFDNEYFGFTEREALRTFPEHRLFLTNAIKAFYHAGYNETSLKKTNTGIFFSECKSVYANYSNISDVSFSDFDFVKGIEATRLAKYLDLRGPIVAINTSCSSSLVALNSARQSLITGECDMAIVGGAKTLSLTEVDAMGYVVHSRKGECRPFDEDADGMINGEGAIFFVLKRYEEALKDGDSIFGEIKGAALNHGGDRISSLTAPSSEAQRDVILKAWKSANVDIKKMKYIEAHGTGTILGDPIEVEGIKQAFYHSTPPDKNVSLALSSFKGQIGHLDFLSGLAGLLRLVAALNFKIIPLQANLNKLNDFFNIEDTGLYVPTSTEPWDSDENERIGGVSSYGLTGTNVHVVVSQQEKNLTKSNNQKEINYLQVSHQNEKKLKLFKDYLIDKINDIDNIEDINKLCSKLNKVFQVDKETQGIIYSSKESLITALKSKRQSSPIKERVLMLLDLDILSYPKEFIKSVINENKFIKKQWEEHVALQIEEIENDVALNTLFQYTLYKYLFEKLGSKIKLITTKEDSIVNLLLKSKITVLEVTNSISKGREELKSFNEEAFKKYLKGNLNSKEIILVDFSKKNKNRFEDLNLNLKVIDGSFSDNDRFQLYSRILDLGINPLMVNANAVFNDVELPYLFPKRFWPDVNVKPLVNEFKVKEATKDNVKEIITYVWVSVLETSQINEDDDFFEIGGTSLLALDMIEEIEKNIKGVKIPYENIYTLATMNKLVAFVSSQLNTVSDHLNDKENNKPKLDKDQLSTVIRNIWISLLEADNFNEEDDFFEIGGTSLLALEMLDELEKKVDGLKVYYEDIYSCSTISKLVNKITSQNNQADVTINKKSQKFDVKLRENQYGELIDRIEKEEFLKIVPDNIFVTGGTGLLGMAIIDYLIDNTNATLYCLVRKKEYNSAEQRFWSLFERHYEIKNKERIHVIEGDLYSENLGVEKTKEICNHIDMIYHIAGSPQFVSKKSVKDHINFIGTKNIVDWANNNKITNLNFISTVGVVGKVMPVEIKNFYETDIDLGQESENLIHGASKLKAEKYIQDHYNYKSKVFRISNLGGRFRDGSFSTDLNKNLMWLRLKELSKLKFYCKEILNESSGIRFIPVDITSALISQISFANIESLNIYHINSGTPFSNEEVLKSLKKIGVKLEPKSYDDFMSYVGDNHKFNFHKVAQNENEYEYRSDATNRIISKLDLDKNRNFDKLTYLERLVCANLK